jgi:hypothetical protein
MAARPWTVHYFSLANPPGDGRDDIPALLRRLADAIEERQPIEVQDISFAINVRAVDPWPSATVYYVEPAPTGPLADPAD